MVGRPIARLVADVYRRRFPLITLRTMSDQTGPNRAPNPPIMVNPVLHAALAPGATTMAIDCTIAAGSINVGDIIEFPPRRFTVQAPVTSRAVGTTPPGFDNITFFPPVIDAVAAGTAVTMIYAGDHPIRANVTPYKDYLVDGSIIQAEDVMVMIPAYDLSIPGPMARPDVKTQRLVINGPDRCPQDPFGRSGHGKPGRNRRIQDPGPLMPFDGGDFFGREPEPQPELFRFAEAWLWALLFAEICCVLLIAMFRAAAR